MVLIRNAILGDADALAHIMIESNDQAFRGRVPDRCLSWITPQESAANWRRTIGPGGMCDGDGLLVAETAEGTVVGFALARAPRELKVISVKPAIQRQGVGRQLVRAAAEHFRRFGGTSMIVHVLRVNPNCAFYERLGAQFLREEPRDWNGVVLPECVYEWKDVSALLAPEP